MRDTEELVLVLLLDEEVPLEDLEWPREVFDWTTLLEEPAGGGDRSVRFADRRAAANFAPASC